MAGITAEKIQSIVRAARQYLLHNIGNLTLPGMPQFDAERQAWRVPILCQTEWGMLRAGEMLLDDAGKILSAPTREEIGQTVEKLLCVLCSEGQRSQAAKALDG